MSNKYFFHAGLFCMKEAVYNVLLEVSEAGSPEMSNKEICEILDIEKSYRDPDSYTLLRGVLDELWRDDRVKRVDSGRKMIWRVVS